MKKNLAIIVVILVVLDIVAFWFVNNKRVQINQKLITNQSIPTNNTAPSVPATEPNIKAVIVEKIVGQTIYYKVPVDGSEQSADIPLSAKIFGPIDQKTQIYPEIKLSDVKPAQVVEITWSADSSTVLKVTVLQ